MNRKAQMNFNPVYVLLAVLGGAIAYFVAGRASEGPLIPVMSGLVTVIVSYFYLVFTEK